MTGAAGEVSLSREQWLILGQIGILEALSDRNPGVEGRWSEILC